ncbi:MAG: SRPBCC family protein [Microthrixaceae bacterium]
MSGSEQKVSVSRVIKADAQKIFDVIADPTLHHVIDGSGTVRHASGKSRKLSLGDKFSTNMRLYVPYRMSNKVVEYTEGRVIAWSHVGGWRWRYELESISEGEDAGSTRVTESFDWSTAKAGLYVTALGWPKRNLAGMKKTLARLDAFVSNTNSAL